MSIEGPAAEPRGSAVPVRSDRPGRTIARLAKVVELALGEVDLSLPQYRALAYLDAGSSAPSALAGQLAVTKPTITALIDGLVARGFVERRTDPDDRRRIVHEVTPAGRAALAAADVAVDGALDRLLEHLPDRDRAKALGGLGPWARALTRALVARTEAGR